MARTKIKQDFRFNRKIIDSAGYRVVLSDKRISSAVLDWSILNLWASGGCANNSLLFKSINFSPIGSKGVALRYFSETPTQGAFLWNSFVCANYLSQPLTFSYTRRIAGGGHKSRLLVTQNELAKIVFAWLVGAISGEIPGRGLGTRVSLPPIPTYFRLLEFWFSLNGHWGEELSPIPSFLSRRWGSVFVPFLSFSLKNAFSLSGSFATFYPFFSLSRRFGGSGYKFTRIFSAGNAFGLVLNYIDQLPYESRTEFFFRSNSSHVREFEPNNFLRQRFFKTFTFQLGIEFLEPSLGDRANPLIPHHFYFNEFDFLKLPLKVTNFWGNSDPLLANEFLRLIFPWSSVNIWFYIFNLWKLFAAPSLIKNDRAFRRVLFVCKTVYRDHINRWVVFFYQHGRLQRSFFENFCKNSNLSFYHKNYSYNNLTRPFFLLLYLLRLSNIQVQAWFTWNFILVDIFLTNCGYLFRIESLFTSIFFYKSLRKCTIFVALFCEFYLYIKFFLKTCVYFCGIVFRKFNVRLGFGLWLGMFILLTFFLFNWSEVFFFCIISLLIFLLGLVFRRFIARTAALYSKGAALPRVNLYFNFTSILLINFRFFRELFGRLFLELVFSYRGLYVFCATTFRFLNFWFKFYLTLLSNFKRTGALGASVLLSLLDSAFVGKNRWRLGYNVFYVSPNARFWHIFIVNLVINGGYGWWMNPLHVGLQFYAMQYHLNRLTTLSYESTQLVGAKLGLNSVYGEVNTKDLRLLTHSFWSLVTFRKSPLLSTFYNICNAPSFVGGSLLRVNLLSSESLNKEFFLKLTKVPSAEDTQITQIFSIFRFLRFFAIIALRGCLWLFFNAVFAISCVVYNLLLFGAKVILIGTAAQLLAFFLHFLIFFCTIKVYTVWYILIKCFVIFLLLRK